MAKYLGKGKESCHDLSVTEMIISRPFSYSLVASRPPTIQVPSISTNLTPSIMQQTGTKTPGK